MLDRVARLPGAPCLLDRGTQLGEIAFYHVHGSCRAVPGSRGEIKRENIVLRGDFFYAESVECKTKVLYTEKRPLAEWAIKKKLTCCQNVSSVGHFVYCA